MLGVAYLHPRDFTLKWLLGASGEQLDTKLVVLVFAAFVYPALEGSPATYYLYILFPLIYGIVAWNHVGLMKEELWSSKAKGGASWSGWKQFAEIALIMLCLELVVVEYETPQNFCRALRTTCSMALREHSECE